MQGVQLKLNLDAEMMRRHVQVVHEGDDGYIALCSMADGGAFSQRHYLLDDLVCQLDLLKVDGEKNYYFSVNSFFRPQRVLENVRQIRALFADIDCHHMDAGRSRLAVEDTVRYLELVYDRGELPAPSIVVKTGRGVQLYWLIDDLPRHGVPLWKLVQDAMTERLTEVLARLDVKVDNISDVSRVLRLSGTQNTKARVMATLTIKTQHRRRLDAIIGEYFPELAQVDKPPRKKTAQPGKLDYLYNLYSLHYTRLCDIAKLVELRKGQLGSDECRRRVVFLYRYWSCCYLNDTARALEETQEFNKGFSQPLPPGVVRSASQSAEKAYRAWLSGAMVKVGEQNYRRGYNYKNSTLIRMLGITPEEQREMQTIIGKEEKYRRNDERRYGKDSDGLTAKQRQRLERIAKAKELAEKGLTQRAISIELGCSQKTVSNYLSNF